jgi:hypothetical protein
MTNIFYILTKAIIEWPYFSLLKNQTEKQLKRVAMTKKIAGSSIGHQGSIPP